MGGMPQIVLLAGILMLLYGAAVVAGDRVAATSPMRSHSRVYGLVVGGAGSVLVIVGTALLLSG